MAEPRTAALFFRKRYVEFIEILYTFKWLSGRCFISCKFKKSCSFSHGSRLLSDKLKGFYLSLFMGYS